MQAASPIPPWRKAGGIPAGRGKPHGRWAAAWAAACLALIAPPSPDAEPPPPEFKVAFLGDQGLGPGSQATLRLVRDEGADMLVHLGDFDYAYNPAAWRAQSDSILGEDFPQIAVVGNHDLSAWHGAGGYARIIEDRLRRMGVAVEGEAGVQCSFRYKGLFFVLTAPGLMGTGHPEFIRRELAADTSIWRISAWHVNQARMQVGSKWDEAGWGVYEESRKGGAIIATAHEHSYSRTHLLENMVTQKVASRGNRLHIRRGRTFAFVSGLGGGDIRPQLLSGDWWASMYTSTQGARHGALFAVFHVDGDPRKAEFYFKDVEGAEIDRFEVVSEISHEPPPEPGIQAPPARPGVLEVDPGRFGIPIGAELRLEDLAGRVVARIESLEGPVSIAVRRPGLMILRSRAKGHRQIRKVVVLP